MKVKVKVRELQTVTEKNVEVEIKNYSEYIYVMSNLKIQKYKFKKIEAHMLSVVYENCSNKEDLIHRDFEKTNLISFGYRDYEDINSANKILAFYIKDEIQKIEKDIVVKNNEIKNLKEVLKEADAYSETNKN